MLAEKPGRARFHGAVLSRSVPDRASWPGELSEPLSLGLAKLLIKVEAHALKVSIR